MDEKVCLNCKETVTFGKNCKCTFSGNNVKKFSLRKLEASYPTNALNIKAKVKHLSASVENYSKLCSDFQQIQMKDYDNVKSPKNEIKEEEIITSDLNRIKKLSLLSDETRTIESFQNQYSNLISFNFIKQDVYSDKFYFKDSTKHFSAGFEPKTEFWRSWETKEISTLGSEECILMSQKKNSSSLFLEEKLRQNYYNTASQETNLVNKYFSTMSNFSVNTNVLPVNKLAYNNVNEKTEENLTKSLNFPKVILQPVYESKSLFDKVSSSIESMKDKNNVLGPCEDQSHFITSQNMKPIVEKNYECVHSEKSFCNQGFLPKIYKSDFANNVIACDNSQKCMPHRDQLERQKKRKRTLEKQFVCNICEKRFPWKHSLNSHYRMHTGEKSFVCDKCGKGFARKSNLVNHCRIHTGEKPYECNICEKRFAWKHHLNCHYATHSNERPFGCDFCEKRFKTRDTLVVHHRTHTGEKPFECSTCGKRYRHSYSLVKHNCTNTGEKI